MRSAQFVKGMIGGVEVTYESPQLLEILSPEKLAPMWDETRIGTYKRIGSIDRYTAKTVVTQSEPDEYGRVGVVNHTVIYQFDPSKEAERIKYIIDLEEFRRNARNGMYDFKMPPKPELKKPLDSPPPPEWEVQQRPT
jgi:hypothetical protein